MSREQEVDLQIYKAIQNLLVAVNHCDVIKGSIEMMVHEKVESLQAKCTHENKSLSFHHAYCRDCGAKDL